MAVSSVSGAQSASAVVTQDLRLQQAQRNAERAEVAAHALRQQASAAQRNADRAQEGARSLKVRSDQAQSDAGSARQQLVSLKSVNEVQGRFDTIREQISTGLAALDSAASASTPVVNADGQTTGTLVNVTA